NLGLLLRDTGRLKEAEAAYGVALAIRKQLAANFPTRPEFRCELATSHNNLGVLLSGTGRLKEAEAPFDAALQLRTQLASDLALLSAPTWPQAIPTWACCSARRAG